VRIKTIFAKDIVPIKHLHVDDLSDVVVFAGPNGVGKTRFITWLLQFFQNLPSSQTGWLLVEATCPDELNAWGKKVLDTRDQNDANKLRVTLQKQRRRSAIASSVLNFESNRSITTVQPYQFSWDFTDPFEEQVGWNYGFGALSSRFSDTVHSIFRKVRSRREAIALTVEKLIKERKVAAGEVDAVSLQVDQFPDPLTPFKNAFSQLLAPKVLLDPEAQKQQLYFTDGSATHGEQPITSLSSGEREVVNVVFDFLLRNPSDCIIVFDEPELHLHPELSYKLLQTLRNAGVRNQFIFCTHSAEIISASLDNSVVFIAPAKGTGENQAIAVKEEDETHQALKLMGQSIGIVSLGKKIVLIEGEHGSLDKQTYGAILKNKYPNLVLVPSGGKGLIQSFGSMVDSVLERSIWGVEFFMVYDRDALPSTRSPQDVRNQTSGRAQILSRYHLENYFLDENIIAEMFKPLEQTGSWLTQPDAIRARLIEIARSNISYATALIVAAHFREKVGNLSIMPKGCNGKTVEELTQLLLDGVGRERARIELVIKDQDVKGFTEATMAQLEASLADDTWKEHIPGRVILKTFCSSAHANFDFGRFKISYLKAAEQAAVSPFEEIDSIFNGFANHSA
jgi:hypothetical protein